MQNIIPCRGLIDAVEAKVDRLHIAIQVKWRFEPRLSVILLASRMIKSTLHARDMSVSSVMQFHTTMVKGSEICRIVLG